MTTDQIRQPDPLYQNPVYPRSFPDPFVLKHKGEYYAYCTGHAEDGRVFGVLRSPDLIGWTPVGGAMQELAEPSPFYWAPEVTYWNGTFFLYYSAGNEKFMQLRVAVSDRPDGGFVDAGRRLTNEDFAIDAHVFTDDDGQRYLFYATDFLEHTHIGTGVVVDRMLDWYTLEGKPRPAVRAMYDWQVYDPHRIEKGGVRWHTVEGPFVLKRKGVYYMMFSGGNWQQPTYGVSFAVTDDIARDAEWEQYSDGEKIFPILRTDADEQVGPGHNSVVRGPDNRELYCVYHYWYEGERVLAVNRMDFAGQRIFIDSQPYLPRTRPISPSASFTLVAENWRLDGDGSLAEGTFISGPGGGSLHSPELPGSFLFEVSIVIPVDTGSSAGLRLEAGGRSVAELLLEKRDGGTACRWSTGGATETLSLDNEFRGDAVHLICVKADRGRVSLSLDDTHVAANADLGGLPTAVVLTSAGAGTSFSAFELTSGFEDRFESPEDAVGWSVGGGTAELQVQDGELHISGTNSEGAIIIKGEPAENFEFAVNLRCTAEAASESCYGFSIVDEAGGEIERLEVRSREEASALYDKSGNRTELPESFTPAEVRQFRFRKSGDEIFFDLESRPLGSVPSGPGKMRIAILCPGTPVALEMVRRTVIN